MKHTPLKRKKAFKSIRIDPLDKLFSEYIRLKANGYCQKCRAYKGYKKLMCCHFHGRAMKSVRWDEDNAIAADAGCHNYLDSQPLIKIDFWRNLLGEDRFNMLNSRMRNIYPKPDKKALTLYYTQKIRDLKD